MTIDFLLAKGESNADILISPLPGKIDGKMPIGDVIGKTNLQTSKSKMEQYKYICFRKNSRKRYYWRYRMEIQDLR